MLPNDYQGMAGSHLKVHLILMQTGRQPSTVRELQVRRGDVGPDVEIEGGMLALNLSSGTTRPRAGQKKQAPLATIVQTYENLVRTYNIWIGELSLVPYQQFH
eukprot:324003-Pyramimonas_sp.AAC.1